MLDVCVFGCDFERESVRPIFSWICVWWSYIDCVCVCVCVCV